MTCIEEHAYMALKAIQKWSWALPAALRENDVWDAVDAAIAEIEEVEKENRQFGRL